MKTNFVEGLNFVEECCLKIGLLQDPLQVAMAGITPQGRHQAN